MSICSSLLALPLADANALVTAELLCRKFINACKELIEQEEDFEAMSSSVTPETLEEWEAGVSNWEEDHTKYEDPYVRTHEGKT